MSELNELVRVSSSFAVVSTHARSWPLLVLEASATAAAVAATTRLVRLHVLLLLFACVISFGIGCF